MTDLENELKISKNELKELIYFNKMYFREDLSEKDEEALSNAIYALFCQIFGLYNKEFGNITLTDNITVPLATVGLVFLVI